MWFCILLRTVILNFTVQLNMPKGYGSVPKGLPSHLFCYIRCSQRCILWNTIVQARGPIPVLFWKEVAHFPISNPVLGACWTTPCRGRQIRTRMLCFFCCYHWGGQRELAGPVQSHPEMKERQKLTRLNYLLFCFHLLNLHDNGVAHVTNQLCLIRRNKK